MFAVVIILPAIQAPANAQGTDTLIQKTSIREFLAAAQANDVEVLQRALDQGVPVDARDERGRTALLIATYHNAVEAAKRLIEGGADVNATDALHDSPYLYAGAEGKLEILKLTVAAGADLVSVNRYGGTALIPAAHHGHVNVVRYLVATKIDLDHVNFLGWTALLEAVVLGDGGPIYQEIIRLLVDAGADITIVDKDGKTALDLARASSQSKVVEILENTKN